MSGCLNPNSHVNLIGSIMMVFDLNEDDVMIDAGAAIEGMAIRVFELLPLPLPRISGFESAT